MCMSDNEEDQIEDKTKPNNDSQSEHSQSLNILKQESTANKTSNKIKDAVKKNPFLKLGVGVDNFFRI